MAKEDGVLIDAVQIFSDKRFINIMFQAEDDLLRGEAERLNEVLEQEIMPAGRERFQQRIEAARKLIPFRPKDTNE